MFYIRAMNKRSIEREGGGVKLENLRNKIARQDAIKSVVGPFDVSVPSPPPKERILPDLVSHLESFSPNLKEALSSAAFKWFVT